MHYRQLAWFLDAPATAGDDGLTLRRTDENEMTKEEWLALDGLINRMQGVLKA